MGNHKNKFTWLNQRGRFFQLNKPVYRFCHDAAKICPDLSFMYILGQVNKDLATFFRSCRCLCAVQYVWWLKCDFRFFRITIIRLIVACSYCWTIKIWLIIFLATGKSGELFRGKYFFRTRSLFSATVICFWSIIIHFFFFTLSIAFNSASIIWNVTPIASTMTMKTEFVGGPTVLRC